MTDGHAPAASEISASEVRAELEAVLQSKPFSSSARLSRFLRYVTEETLAGRAASLKEYKLGLEVFGRGEDFDPRVDAVVRVEARQVRFKLADYYAGPGIHDPIIISLPKGGYAPRIERRAPQALDAPAQISLPPTVPEPPRSGVSWLTWSAVAVAFLLLAAAIAIWVWKSGPAGQPPAASIAVLPFTNLSSDPGNQYFSDGLTDEITGELSRVKNLRVIARASAFQFRGKVADIREVGRQLGVATILEGSVERSGDRVKIVAHLERTSDGSHLWARTYARQTADLYAVQSEVAAAIARNFPGAEGPPPSSRRPTQDEQAHDWYMRARYELEQGTPSAVQQAAADFQKAIDRDPMYAKAYAGLGSALYNLGAAHFNSKFTDRSGSERMWRKALALDPALEEAHCGLALLAMQYDWDWRRAEEEARAALAAGPSARAELRYASILIFHGRFKEGGEHLLRSQDIDPLGISYMLTRGQMWILARRPDKARVEIQNVLDRHPDIVQAQSTMSFLDLQDGRPDLAQARMKKLEQREPSVRVLEAAMLAYEGRRDEALRMIRADEQKWETGNVPMASFALVYANMGDVKNTVKWLERSADRHEWQALSIAVNSAFQKMQNDPGFIALKKRIHLLS